jgi:hypothetical protein
VPPGQIAVRPNSDPKHPPDIVAISRVMLDFAFRRGLFWQVALDEKAS